MAMQQLLGTKKGDKGLLANIELCNINEKLSNFGLVAGGICPHCGGNLDDEMPTAGRESIVYVVSVSISGTGTLE